MFMMTGGVFLFFDHFLVLELKNLDHPRSIRIRVTPAEPFFLLYTHSMYDAPVMEEFQTLEGGILLKGVHTKSPAVMEYYGYETTEDFQPSNKWLGNSFLIKKGVKEGQALRTGRAKILLSEVAESGDRIQIRLCSIRAGSYLWQFVLEAISAIHRKK
jgi:hypothetical protein